jgi:hypothetical protein
MVDYDYAMHMAGRNALADVDRDPLPYASELLATARVDARTRRPRCSWSVTAAKQFSRRPLVALYPQWAAVGNIS